MHGVKNKGIENLITEVQVFTEGLDDLAQHCKKENSPPGPNFHPIEKVDPRYLQSLIVPVEKFARRWEPIFGDLNFLIDPSVTDFVSDEDQKFFTERSPNHEVSMSITAG